MPLIPIPAKVSWHVPNSSKSEKQLTIERVTRDGRQHEPDVVAAEEPLEIRVVFGPRERRRSKSLSITMRTPGHDEELAAGFLLSENILSDPQQIDSFEHVGPAPEGGAHGNTLMVELAVGVELEIEKLQRHFYTTSSCGICGKASLDAVRNQGMTELDDSFSLDSGMLFGLPDAIRAQQDVFERTGGLHGAGLFAADGNLVAIREDVGRHNAVDKLVGSQMIACSNSISKARFALSAHVMVVSGRASFELVQKALMARIPMMVAVGAPSSLAVELAREFNMTLLGFASQKRFNIYSGGQRVESQ
jgi:FdhD protein